MSIDGGLRPLFRRKLPQFFWTSVETGGTGLGIPDSHFLLDGASGWVEFKQTDGHAVTLSEFQSAWLSRYDRCGGRAWVAVRRRSSGGPRRGPPCDELYLIPARLAPHARARGLRDPVVREAALPGPWGGGPSAWPWDAVAALLTAPPRTLSAPSGASRPVPACRGLPARRAP